ISGRTRSGHGIGWPYSSSSGTGGIISGIHGRTRAGTGDCPYRFKVPRSFGFWPDLQLALFEGIPGVPQVAQLLNARLQGEGGPPGSPTLEQTIEACARIAATLHTSGISLGRARTLDDELAALDEGFATVERISPDLGAQFR